MLARLKVTALLCFTFTFFASSAFAADVINFISSEIRIRDDKQVFVTESIQFVTEGDRIKYGLMRVFPNPAGTTFSTQFTSLDNAPIEIKTETTRDGRYIAYVGSEKRKLSTGTHSISAQHQATGVVTPQSVGDKLIWNVTGERLQVSIQQVAVEFYLPPGVPQNAARVRAYTKNAAEEKELTVSQHGTQFSIRNTEELKPGEMLFIEAIW